MSVKNPHIWTCNGKSEWYGYKPSENDYSVLANAIDNYTSCFQEPVQECGMKMC